MSDRDQQPQDMPDSIEPNLMDQILSGYADRQNAAPEEDPQAADSDDGIWAAIQSRLEADQAVREDKAPPSFDEGLLCAYADGEFADDDPQISELESWLHGAPEATRLIAAFSAVSETVRTYSYRMEEACDIDVTEAVMNRFRQEQDEKAVPITKFRKSWIAVPAAAAAVLLFAVYAGNPADQQMARNAEVGQSVATAEPLPAEVRKEAESLLASAPAGAKSKDAEMMASEAGAPARQLADAPLREALEGNELRQKEEADTAPMADRLAKTVAASDERNETVGRSRNNDSDLGGFSAGTGATMVFKPDTGLRMASASESARRDTYLGDERKQVRAAAKPAPSAPTVQAEYDSERYLASRLEVSHIPTAEEYVMNYCHSPLPNEADAFDFMYSCVEDVSR